MGIAKDEAWERGFQDQLAASRRQSQYHNWWAGVTVAAAILWAIAILVALATAVF